ncbi:MFS transporter [Paenibacillus sp. SI8]|uniref:MFS transporter n=1 Tax=unclassified Paenibacillus TaxID=185978 RepID=UPI00346524B2
MKNKKGLLLLGISLGYFMVLLDTTIVSVALPSIQDELGGKLSTLEWITNAYTLVFASLLLTMGSLSDKLGGKQLYSIGLALLGLSSVIMAITSSISVLISMRAVLGIGAAALLPSSMTLFSHGFPVPSERARAMGIWAGVTGAALAAGPVVGGFLVDTVGWRSIFMLNVPIALISFGLARAFISETPRQSQKSIDLPGQLTAMAALGLFTFALIESQTLGWRSPWVLTTLCLALLAAALFIRIEIRASHPMLPLHLFHIRALSAGMSAGILINFGFSGILFIMPLFFHHVWGYSASVTGLVFLPLTLPTVVGPIMAGRVVSRIGPKLPMTFGFIATSVGAFLLAAATFYPKGGVTMIIAMVLLGFGSAFTIPPLVTATLSASPQGQTGIVSGALNTSRQLGAVLGVAILGAILHGNSSYSAGAQLNLAITGVLLLGGSVLSYRYMGIQQKNN